MRTIHTVAAGAIAALAVAAIAYAQPFAGMGPGFGPGMGMGPGFGHGFGPGMGMGPGFGHGFGPGMGMGPWHGPMAGADPALIDARLGYFKAQLKITPAQEGAFQTFADAAKEQAASMQALRTEMYQTYQAAGTAPERISQHTKLMEQRTAAMTKMSDAFSALYAVLTPDQKAIADQHAGPMPHRGWAFAGRTG